MSKTLAFLIATVVFTAGCAAQPATLHKLDDGFRAQWAGYDVEIPEEAVITHGFEITVTPSDDDHEDRVAADATLLPLGDWVDGEIESEGDVDLFVFKGERKPRTIYRYFILTHHDVDANIQGDGVGRGWTQVDLYPSTGHCLPNYDYGGRSLRSDEDGYCRYRSGRVPFYGSATTERYIRVAGFDPPQRYSLLVLEDE